MKNKTYILFLSMFFMTCLGFAQQTITGVVKDSGNQPLPGVIIQVKGTNNATMSDFDGNYTIDANAGDVLVVTMMGMVPQSIRVEGQTTIDIAMKDDVAELDEVVVVGYGSVAKKDLTGAVAVVKPKELEIAPVANFDQAIAGRITGVTVTSNEGTPGEALKIVVRGGNSLTGSNDPLYVVNGIPLEDFDPSTINTTDLESFQVLKDASATAIYGSRGANGVVVITTKSGKTDGTTDVTFDFGTAISEITNRLEVMSPFQYVKHLENQALARDGFQYGGQYMDAFHEKWVSPEYYKDVEGRDYQKEAFQMGQLNRANFSIRGGNENTNIFFSVGLVDQEGVLITTGFKKVNTNFTIRHKINDKLSFFGVANYTNTNRYGSRMRNGRGNQELKNIIIYRPVDPLNLDPGEGNGELDDDIDDNDYNNMFDPIRNLNGTVREDKAHLIRTNATLTYKINNNFTLKSANGANTTIGQEELFYKLDTQQGTRSENGINGQINGYQRQTISSSNTLTFNKKVRKSRYNALAGIEFVQNTRSTSRMWNKRLPTDEFGIDNLDIATLPTISQTELWKHNLLSYFGRFNYNYDQRYLVTATMRADGSSKFLGEHRWGYFPSGSFAWQIGNEDFMESVSFVNSLKARVGWGITGNNRVPEYAAHNQFGISIWNGYTFGTDEQYQPGGVQTVLAMPDLRWESTEQRNIGVDYSVLNSRISGTIDYYEKYTKDLLLNADMSPSTGFQRTPQNVGRVSNKGFEFSINALVVDSGDFRWNTDFNISTNTNRVEALNQGQEFIKSDPQVGWNDEFWYISELGNPAGMMYGLQYDGLYQAEDFTYRPDLNAESPYVLKPGLPTYTGEVGPGSAKYVDQNGDGIIDQNDRVVIGNPHPKHYGGWNNSFKYKNFDLAVLLQWSYDFDVANGNRAMWAYPTHNGNFSKLAEAADAWTPWNTDGNVIAHYTNGIAPYPREGYRFDSRYVEDGSYLRLKTVTFGYTVPLKSGSGIKNLRLALSGQNLFTWTNYSGFDPEVSIYGDALRPNLDYSAYPQSRTYSFSVRARF